MDMKDMIGSKLGLLDSAVVTSIDRRDIRNGGEACERSYKVQFNPNELTLDASVHIEPFSDAERAETLGSEAATPLKIANPQAFLTVRLVFDEMYPADAFTADSFTLSAAGIAKSAIGKATGRSSKRSVQPIVEGFIGSIRNSDTRLLRFNWGEFRFTGFLHHIHAEYVMFSASGDPIRAFVTLRIKNDFESDIGMWLDEIKAMKNEQGVSGLSRVKSAAGSLLNIGW